MLDSLPVYIVDTNILIDLYVGGVLQAAFRLPILLAAPDVLIAELCEPDGTLLLDYGLASIELSSREVQEVDRLAGLYHRPAVNDLFSLATAKTLKATLLTGDQHLRQAAEQEGVPVHGTLWLLDEMVQRAMIPSSLAARVLERMLARGRRLPLDECEKRLRRWKGTI